MWDLLFNNGWQIAQTGIAGVMLALVWGLMVKKDDRLYNLIDRQEVDRKEVYVNMTELVKEVTAALVSKNLTDERLSEVTDKLTKEMIEIKAILTERKSNEGS